jgi:hypothetical protein
LIFDHTEEHADHFANPQITLVAIGANQRLAVGCVQRENVTTLEDNVWLVVFAVFHDRDLIFDRTVLNVLDFDEVFAAIFSHIRCPVLYGARV